jgi:microcompartment protein CcmK/EutM
MNEDQGSSLLFIIHYSPFIIHHSVSPMFLARVVGTVVSTIKDPQLAAKKILIVQPIDKTGKDSGQKLVAVDSVGTGAGETVYCCRGREASFPWYPEEVPTDATIVAIVDTVSIGGKAVT